LSIFAASDRRPPLHSAPMDEGDGRCSA
jgi:hypothetical protein